MSDNAAASRFTAQNKTTDQRLSTNTVGLVALSDYRKRRAEVVEQQERETREAAFVGSGTGTSTPDRSLAGTPDNAGSDAADGGAGGGSGVRPLKKKKKRAAKKLLSFDDEEGDEGESGSGEAKKEDTDADADTDNTTTPTSDPKPKSKFKPNTSIGLAPRSLTKAALRKDAEERDTLRREFVAVQEAIKATEVALPFVFYDGANTPGGTVRMKKGDLIWLFLDRSRKVGAELGVGDQSSNAQKAWARVGVDDLMLVRGTVIIPHHYDFYFFVVNRSVGPGGQRLFDYSDRAPRKPDPNSASAVPKPTSVADVNTLDGANDDPMVTKVVDRRWYERNKHIYPASMWQVFDPEKDYAAEVRKDTGGNTFFFSR